MYHKVILLFLILAILVSTQIVTGLTYNRPTGPGIIPDVIRPPALTHEKPQSTVIQGTLIQNIQSPVSSPPNHRVVTSVNATSASNQSAPKGSSGPVHVGSIISGSGGALLSGPKSVAVSGNYAYVVSQNSNSLEIVDVSNPAAPTHKGSITDGTGGAKLSNPTCVQVAGNYAYVTSGTSTAYNGYGYLEIIDVSNPAAPAHKGVISDGHGSPPYLQNPTCVRVVGNYAYVTSGFYGTLTIIDISNPAAPTYKGGFTNSGLLWIASGVSVLGNYAYVTSYGTNALEIVDVSNPSAPVHKGSISNGAGGALLSAPWWVHVNGNYAYVTSTTANSLEIVDVTNPAAPVHKGSITNGAGGAMLNGPVNVFVSGGYAYLTCARSNVLEIVDVSNPAAPVHKSYILNGDGGAQLYKPVSVYVYGGYAYVASWGSNALEIVGIVTNPPSVSSITPSSGMNSGPTSTTNIAGSYFQDGAVVRLVRTGYSNITATNPICSPTQITCILPITGAAPGTWDVVIINPDGKTATLKGGFTVISNLQARFYGIPGTQVFPYTVQFYDQSGGNPTSWSWEFGDGTIVTEKNPIHTYNASGIYHVNLTIGDGFSSSTTRRLY